MRLAIISLASVAALSGLVGCLPAVQPVPPVPAATSKSATVNFNANGVAIANLLCTANVVNTATLTLNQPTAIVSVTVQDANGNTLGGTAGTGSGSRTFTPDTNSVVFIVTLRKQTVAQSVTITVTP